MLSVSVIISVLIISLTVVPNRNLVRFGWMATGILVIFASVSHGRKPYFLESWMLFWVLIFCFRFLQESFSQNPDQSQESLLVPLFTVGAGTSILSSGLPFLPGSESLWNIGAFSLTLMGIMGFFSMLSEILKWFVESNSRHSSAQSIARLIIILVFLSGLLSFLAGPMIRTMGCDSHCSPDPITCVLVNTGAFPLPFFLHGILSREHATRRVPFLAVMLIWSTFLLWKGCFWARILTPAKDEGNPQQMKGGKPGCINSPGLISEPGIRSLRTK